MDLNKENLKKIRGIILFTAFVVIALVNYKTLLGGLGFMLNIIFPFILGGAIAFLLNAPTRFFEEKLFGNKFMKGKKITARISRPVSLVLAILAIIGIVQLVMFVVVPELGRTVVSLSKTVADFVPQVERWLNELVEGNEIAVAWMQQQEMDWDKIVNSVVEFVQHGVTNVLSSTYGVVRSVVSAVSNFVIGFVFACYIVLQKEKLKRQIQKVCKAILPTKAVNQTERVFSLAYRTFSSFLTGQCVEAVILGVMFFLVMSLLGFPYAVLVGVLIAFTALIPIFGAFIGCFVGAFLILMVNPMQALAFVVLFLILQQVEGNLIYPHVVGGSVGLPSIWVLMAVTVGGSLMGIVGMLVFIPLVSVIYNLFREFVYNRLREKEEQLGEESV